MANCRTGQAKGEFHSLADMSKQLRHQIESGDGKALSDGQLEDLKQELSLVESEWDAKTPLPAFFVAQPRNVF
jgi:hypothetical protein